MQKLAILVFGAVLLASVSANDFELLQEMQSYDFGKTILQTIQIELSQGGNSATTVLKQLRDMKESAEQELNESKEIQAQRTQQCAQDLEAIDQVLNQALAQKADDERLLPLKDEQLQDKDQQLRDKQTQELRSQTRITTLIHQRQDDAQAYNARIAENQGLVDTLQQAKQIISQLAARNSFLQKPEEIKAKLEKHNQNIVKLMGDKKGYFALIEMLIEAAQDSNVSSDHQLVGSVVQIIDELVESLYRLQKVEQKSEQERTQLYETEKARIELEMSTLESQLATLKADREHLSQKLLELNNDISAKTRVIDNKSQQNKDQVKICYDQSTISMKRTEQKNSELNILLSCIEIFETRYTDAVRSFIQRMQIDN